MMKKKFKVLLPALTVMLLLGAFAFPVTAYAQTSDTTPPTITATLSGDTLLCRRAGAYCLQPMAHRQLQTMDCRAALAMTGYSLWHLLNRL